MQFEICLIISIEKKKSNAHTFFIKRTRRYTQLYIPHIGGPTILTSLSQISVNRLNFFDLKNITDVFSVLGQKQKQKISMLFCTIMIFEYAHHNKENKSKQNANAGNIHAFLFGL